MQLLLTRIGVALGACFLAVILISPAFVEGALLTAQSAFAFTGLMIAAGGVYLLLFRTFGKNDVCSGRLALFLIAGLLFRLLFFGTIPIYEDDWRRYLWDGAVIAEGVNPYRYAPAQAATEDFAGDPVVRSDDPALRKLQDLGATQEEWPELVNYPYVTTIYPPVAEAAMAAAHMASPFNLDAWRFVLLLFDCAGLAFLLRILKKQRRNPGLSLLYWWNPLLIVTTYNAAHMDILLAPFLLGAFLLVSVNRPLTGALALAGAVGVKLWPVLLAPVLFAPLLKTPRRLAAAALCLIGSSAILLTPMLFTAASARSGLIAYASEWETFSFMFGILKSGLAGISSNPDALARVGAGVLGALAAISAAYATGKTPNRQAAALTVVTAVLLFLSPTGYPWYLIWILIFMPMAPSLGLASLTASLPLYYLRYILHETGHDALLNWGVTPLAFVPALLILYFEWKRRHAA